MVIGQETSKIKRHLPPVMCQWGKVRIANGGNSICCKCAGLPQKDEQNMSFVRVLVFYFPGSNGGLMESLLLLV